MGLATVTATALRRASRRVPAMQSVPGWVTPPSVPTAPRAEWAPHSPWAARAPELPHEAKAPGLVWARASTRARRSVPPSSRCAGSTPPGWGCRSRRTRSGRACTRSPRQAR